MIRFLAWLIFATWMGRKLLAWFFGSQEKARAATMPGAGSRASQGAGSQLHRDPVCGMYVPEGISLPLEHEGETHHFCSAECREKFRGVQQTRSA